MLGWQVMVYPRVERAELSYITQRVDENLDQFVATKAYQRMDAEHYNIITIGAFKGCLMRLQCVWQSLQSADTLHDAVISVSMHVVSNDKMLGKPLSCLLARCAIP